MLSDDLLLGVLGLLPAQSLALAGLASKSLYCFCNYEELWRVLLLEVTTAAWIDHVHLHVHLLYAPVGYGCCAQSEVCRYCPIAHKGLLLPGIGCLCTVRAVA